MQTHFYNLLLYDRLYSLIPLIRHFSSKTIFKIANTTSPLCHFQSSMALALLFMSLGVLQSSCNAYILVTCLNARLSSECQAE